MKDTVTGLNDLNADVLMVEYKTVEDLLNAYMPFVKSGGLFIATARDYHLGDEVSLQLSLLNETDKHAVEAKVIWITPKRAQGRRKAGIGVQFTQDQSGDLRKRIESYLSRALNTDKPTDTM